MAGMIARPFEGRVSRRLRKKIEMLFAHFERPLRLDALGHRGPIEARDELLLVVTAQNLRKPARLTPIPIPDPRNRCAGERAHHGPAGSDRAPALSRRVGSFFRQPAIG